MLRHSYYEVNIAGRAALFLKTLGDGSGSMYRVSFIHTFFRFIPQKNVTTNLFWQICGKDDPNIGRLVSDFAEENVSNLKFHFYNIENPIEYLNGEDAIAVEKGPYMLKYVTLLI